jgi:CheY-like chemotaxis protein/curved DNA-binding protein CbpA
LPGAILCVDDDRSLCQILAKALSGEGYEVQTAFDGDGALEELVEGRPALVLLDLILPRRDGFAVLEAIRAMEAPFCETPVVIVTGCSPTPAYRDRARSLGAVEMVSKPLPLKDLYALVARYASEPKAEIPVSEKTRSGVAQRRLKGLSGTLEQTPLPSLLHNLHGLRATGVLHLTDGPKRKWMQFCEGYPRALRSNLINECLGNFLVRGGRISQAIFAESRRLLRPGRRQGETLIAMDIMSEGEVAAALRAQADEKFFEIFGWTSGSYRFEKGATLQRGNLLGVERSPANLILQGVRERFPEAQVENFFQSHSASHIAHAESPFYQYQEVDLGADHEALLSKLDGSKRLAEFLTADIDLKRTLYAMLACGLLELRGGDLQQFPRPARPEPTTRKIREEEDLRARLAILAERMRDQSYFEILGVEADAEMETVRDAFEQRAARLHPDRYRKSGQAVAHLAKEVFAHLNTAYQTLSDTRRREEYRINQRQVVRDAKREEDAQKALKAEVQYQQGQLLLTQHANLRALAAFGQALELYPAEGEYHAHYGWTLHLCHPEDPAMTSEAIEHIRRGIKLAPHREKSYLFMGRLCMATGRTEVAEKMFTRAAQIQPECIEALRELRLIDMRRNQSKGLIGRLLGRHGRLLGRYCRQHGR